MKIIHKLILLFIAITALIWVAGHFAVNSSINTLKGSLAANTELLASTLLSEIEKNIYSRAEALQVYSSNVTLKKNLKAVGNEPLTDKASPSLEKTDKVWASLPPEVTTPGMQKILDNRLSTELQGMKDFYAAKYNHNIFNNIYITNSTGRTVAMTGRTDRYLHADSAWWKDTVANALLFGDIAFDKLSDKRAISISVRVDDDNGNLIGVIRAILDVENFLAPLKELNNQLALNNGLFTYALYNRDGGLINSNTNIDETNDDLGAGNPDPLKHIAATDYTVIEKSDGETFVVHTRSGRDKESGGLGWTLAIEQDSSILFAPIHKLRRGIIIASVFFTLLLALFGLYVIRAIAHPIKKVHEAADRVTNGELDIRIAVNKSDELGALATNFNRMTSSLQQAIEVRDKEITERKISEEQVRHIAYHDSLTGLPNRALFKDRVDQVLLRGRWHKTLAAILFLDLDRFKAINDSLGHDAGDELLVTVAERLKKCTRDGDTTARIGGDEFTILCQDIARVEDLSIIVDKILCAFRRPMTIKGHDILVSTSIGISLYPTDGLDAEVLIKNADLAMYRAKSRGRNTCQHFMPIMAEKSLERLRMENKLRNAIEDMDFTLKYQPLIDLNTGKITGAEALIRWNDSELGDVSPATFIPLAEENGDILPIGRWVLEEACKQNLQWQKMGLANIPIAVNISSGIFKESGFVNMVRSILHESGLEARYLELEVTESIIMDHTDEVLFRMRQLRDFGVLFSIDDFGTGYSSLSYLKKLPINKLKIDRTFINDLVENKEDRSIVETIVTLGHNLDLTVLAEGVETEEQLAVLLEADCDMVQGFLLSEPMTPVDFLKLLQKKQNFVMKGPKWRKSV